MRYACRDGFSLWFLAGDDHLENADLQDSAYIFLPKTYSIRRGWPSVTVPVFAGPKDDRRMVGRVVSVEPMRQEWMSLPAMISSFSPSIERANEPSFFEPKPSSKDAAGFGAGKHPIFDLDHNYMYICKVARGFAQTNSARLRVLDTVTGDGKVKPGLRLEVFPAWKSDSLEWSTIEVTPGVKIQGMVPSEMAFVHRWVGWAWVE